MKTLLLLLEMIKFEHTVFALPFAFLGAFLAARGFPGWETSFWIILAMVGARSAAMAFNRLVDRTHDSLNPRTASRALPLGLVSKRAVVLFVLVSAALFLLASWMLNPLAFILSPLALGTVLFYSYTKRFTSLSHLALGLCLAVSPMGGWIAVGGRLDLEPLIIAAAVLFWVAGFDIIYACQDVAADRRLGLHSIPRKLGVEKSLQLSIFFHIVMVALLSYCLLLFELTWVSWIGLILVAGTLVYEHRLISPQDLSRVNLAFFTLNGVISVVLFVFVGLDLWLFQ